jgi:hypothetical protein
MGDPNPNGLVVAVISRKEESFSRLKGYLFSTQVSIGRSRMVPSLIQNPREWPVREDVVGGLL